MRNNYEIVLRQCLKYAYTRLDIKEHTTEYMKHNDCLHFIFKLNDLDKIEFKIKTFKKMNNTLYDLENYKLYNLFRHRLEKIINVRNLIHKIVENINILQERNVQIYNELTKNKSELENLKHELTHYKKLEIGAMYE